MDGQWLIKFAWRMLSRVKREDKVGGKLGKRVRHGIHRKLGDGVDVEGGTGRARCDGARSGCS